MESRSGAWPSIVPAPHRSRILLVEDELLIRMVVSEQLRDVGYDVIEAFNGDEALTILQTGVRIDLVVSDVRMPGSLDGLGLLAIVREMSATLPVILTSADVCASLAAAGGASRFLAKPYTLASIESTVRAELAKIA